MTPAPQIIFTVTNDLVYDQRMQRICTTLANAGYNITLVGRLLPGSPALDKRKYQQIRLKCRYHSGKLFYLEYNWRLYWFLRNATKIASSLNMALCAIDLDTILPILRASRKAKLPRVYDAHELFTELTEVKRRRIISAAWQWVEQTAVPKFKFGYTVNHFIAGELKRRYKVDYEVIRNLPVRPAFAIAMPNETVQLPAGNFFLYQGAVNEGRGFETLIPAMKQVDARLVIAGNGNFYQKAKAICKEHALEDKVHFLGYVKPDELKTLTTYAYAGITIFENSGLNQYYSLANRYFDYIQGGIPQLCVDYPEYNLINSQYNTALLISDLSSDSIAASLNKLLDDTVLYNELKRNCVPAAKLLCWENEAEKLVSYWNSILPIK